MVVFLHENQLQKEYTLCKIIKTIIRCLVALTAIKTNPLAWSLVQKETK
jgi:hypothetical protein